MQICYDKEDTTNRRSVEVLAATLLALSQEDRLTLTALRLAKVNE
jgi:hypothetical protein